MTVRINSLIANKIDNLISQDMDKLAHAVYHKEDNAVFVDIVVRSVSGVLVGEEAVVFMFSNGNMFVAEINRNDYYEIEVA